MAKVQGIQGSYNYVSKNVVEDTRRFMREWVKGMTQALRYNERERRRWEDLLKGK